MSCGIAHSSERNREEIMWSIVIRFFEYLLASVKVVSYQSVKGNELIKVLRFSCKHDRETNVRSKKLTIGRGVPATRLVQTANLRLITTNCRR